MIRKNLKQETHSSRISTVGAQRLGSQVHRLGVQTPKMGFPSPKMGFGFQTPTEAIPECVFSRRLEKLLRFILNESDPDINFSCYNALAMLLKSSAFTFNSPNDSTV